VNKAEAVYLSGLLADCRAQGIVSTYLPPLERLLERRQVDGRTTTGPKSKAAIAKRKPDSRRLVQAKAEVRRRSHGRCEARSGPWCTGGMEHAHHKRRRSQGGQDAPENLLAVCGACHDAIHRDVERSFLHGWLLHAAPVDYGRGITS
jgi:hypothetical protein